MADGIQLKLTGDAQLIIALRTLPDKIDQRVTANAMRAGARLIAKATKANIQGGHVVSGNLLAGIIVKSRWYKTAGIFAAYVGGRWGKGGAAHLHLLEKGHQMVVGGKLSAGGRVVGQVRAFPVVEPAFDSTAGAARARIEKNFRRGVAREAAKLPKGPAR